MTELNTISGQVHRVSSAFGEPDWLLALREAAWKQFVEMPQPWIEKTNLNHRTWDTGTFSIDVEKVPVDVQTYASGLAHSYALFVDGLLVDLKLTDEAKAAGVVYQTIHEAATANESVLKKHLGTVVKSDESKWAALNQSAFAGGVFLHVPKNVQIEVPFETIYVWSGKESGSYPRSLVVVEELSDIQYAETTFSAVDGVKVASSHVLEVIAMPNSRVHVATADELQKGPTYFVTRRARVEKDAKVRWTIGDISNGFGVETVENVLQGNGANGLTRVVGLGYGRAHFNLTASMKHVGRNTESEIIMHAALRGRANTIYRSLTEIVKGAVGAGSEQHDRMIMVDGTARADAIPMLLIDENDVNRCGHAASVGKIDAIQIYYLMSRGIPYAQAMKMIIWGYLRDSVDALPTEAMRNLVVERIERELGR